MQPKDLLPHSQEPTICPYSGPVQSSPYLPLIFLKIQLNIIFTIPYCVAWTADCIVKLSTLINKVTCASVKGSLSPQNIATGELMLSST
jgi:hypothetical protein